MHTALSILKFRAHLTYRISTDIFDYILIQYVDLDKALICASKIGDIEECKYLVSVGANVHAFDSQCLQAAAYNNYFELSQYLISLGMSTTEKNYALKAAIIKNRSDLSTVKYLISVGANSRAQYTLHCDALRIAAIYSDNIDLFKYLVSVMDGAPSQSSLNNAYTTACVKGRHDITRYLEMLEKRLYNS